MDPISRAYKPTFLNAYNRSNNPAVNSYTGRHNAAGILPGPGEGEGVREVSIRFRMIIKVDAGIARGMALDEELLVVTESPAAVQCIRWTPDAKGTQTTTELLSRMSWLEKKVMVWDMVHDRAMNMSAWVTNDGRAYIVHRVNPLTEVDQTAQGRLFKGHCFHTPASSEEGATKVVINARFSLLAVACEK
jgi:RAB6A-GEF complex partner protein 1